MLILVLKVRRNYPYVGGGAQYVKTPGYSKRPLWYGTLAQLARIVQQAARTAGAHRAVVKSKYTIP